MKSKIVLQRIRILRKKSGMSQLALAKKLGMSQNALSKIELGEIELSLSHLYQLADLLEIDLFDLVRIDDPSSTT